MLVHDFSSPIAEDLRLLHKLLKAFKATLHLLQSDIHNLAAEKALIKNNMEIFASLNNISNYRCHVMNDEEVEKDVVHFEQLSSMDIVSIGTYGRGGYFIRV